MKQPKTTVSKNIKEKPIKWTVTHPDGHIYSVIELEPMLNRQSATKSELKKRGWSFEPHYAPKNSNE
jgi:hypothetical protein